MEIAPPVIVAAPIGVPITPTIIVPVGVCRTIVEVGTEMRSVMLAPLATLISLVVIPCESSARVQHRKCRTENQCWQSKFFPHNCLLFSLILLDGTEREQVTGPKFL